MVGTGTRLAIAATPTGLFRLALHTDTLNLSTTWSGLHNPELDPREIPGGAEGVANHASTRMKERAARRSQRQNRLGNRPVIRGGAEGRSMFETAEEVDEDSEDSDEGGGDGEVWAEVLVDARDWGRVLSVGRLPGSRVVCCISDRQAAVMYVYPPGEEGLGAGAEGGSALTVSWILTPHPGARGADS